MSENPKSGASTIRPSKGHSDDNGGGPGKWLLAASAAVVLLGGGYMAWTAMSPTQQQTEIAYNDPYAEDPLRAAPMEGEQATAEAAGAPGGEGVAPESAELQPAPAPARRPAARPAPVTEETIGITHVSAEAAGGDDIVVTARRPIWARTPSQRQLSGLYPQRALDRGQEGEASLSCTVINGGALDCERISETPGFGYPALRVARELRHAPRLADGRDAVGSQVNLRVVFRIDEQEARARGARLRS